MVGSMDTMASSAVSREMVVFLEDTPRQCPRVLWDKWPGPKAGQSLCVIPRALSVFEDFKVGRGGSLSYGAGMRPECGCGSAGRRLPSASLPLGATGAGTSPRKQFLAGKPSLHTPPTPRPLGLC